MYELFVVYCRNNTEERPPPPWTRLMNFLNGYVEKLKSFCENMAEEEQPIKLEELKKLNDENKMEAERNE